jgi:hypothetical protein
MKLNDTYIVVDFIFKGIVSILAIGSTFWFASSLKKLKPLEELISSIQDEIDNLEQTIHKRSGGISQPILDARVAHERKPLEAKLNKLKMERQFILDKIPLVGFFKK